MSLGRKSTATLSPRTDKMGRARSEIPYFLSLALILDKRLTVAAIERNRSANHILTLIIK